MLKTLGSGCQLATDAVVERRGGGGEGEGKELGEGGEMMERQQTEVPLKCLKTHFLFCVDYEYHYS